jgi:2-polyprenyl-6-methoxyphenol hydroxylase-like FAD-dependent oxidoreductase
VDVAVVERRASQDLPGSRAGGLHSRTIEVLDQRGIAERFLSEGQVAQVVTGQLMSDPPMDGRQPSTGRRTGKIQRGGAPQT